MRHCDSVPSAWSLLRVNACVRSLLFSGEARAPPDCRQKDFRIWGDGKVYRGVYLRLYKSCTKICILAASTGWEAHRRRTAVFISRENSVFGPKKSIRVGMTFIKQNLLDMHACRIMWAYVATALHTIYVDNM